MEAKYSLLHQPWLFTEKNDFVCECREAHFISGSVPLIQWSGIQYIEWKNHYVWLAGNQYSVLKLWCLQGTGNQ